MKSSRLIIDTGLDDYILIDCISDICDYMIKASARLKDTAVYLLVEALAQSCAMHARWACGFKKHAALLKINDLEISDIYLPHADISIHAESAGKTSRAHSYSVTALSNNRCIIQGSMIIALIEYDNSFKKDILENHYRELFSCLKK